MIKKSLLSMFIGFLLVNGFLLAYDTPSCMCKSHDLTITGKIILGGLILIAAPHILGPITVAKIGVAVKSAIVLGSNCVIPTSTVGKIGLGLTAAQMARPYILQTTEEKLNELLKEKASRSARTKDEFISCLKANKTDSPRNVFGRPCACEDAALIYAFNSSVAELNKRTEAFKKGECFCY